MRYLLDIITELLLIVYKYIYIYIIIGDFEIYIRIVKLNAWKNLCKQFYLNYLWALLLHRMLIFPIVVYCTIPFFVLYSRLFQQAEISYLNDQVPQISASSFRNLMWYFFHVNSKNRTVYWYWTYFYFLKGALASPPRATASAYYKSLIR